MFDRLEISVLPPGPRWWAQLRFWVNGEDILETAVESEGRGPLAIDELPLAGPSPLRATTQARRLEVGEPDCTGGCCGYLSLTVQQVGQSVLWSDWETPWRCEAPREFCFEAGQYDAEVARAEADGWWRVYH